MFFIISLIVFIISYILIKNEKFEPFAAIMLILSLIGVSISSAYYIATSNIPDWMKFWLLR